MNSAGAHIQVGGAVVPNQHVYITRPEDHLLFDLLLEGQFCNVLTSRQMGKSSLMQRTAMRLRSQGVAVSTMDIAGEIGKESDQELAWKTIIDIVAQNLKIDCDVDVWWHQQPEGTNNRKLLRFFREMVCTRIAGPVVVFFDEIDSTLRLPYADDLFTALRTIYNDRATEEAYRRLTFCLVGVATPNELVKDRRTTAYNIGTTIPLRDFDEQRDDLGALLTVLDVDAAEAGPLLRRILYWTGGHPFLTAKFCKAMAGKSVEDVDAFVQSSYADLSGLRTDEHFSQIVRFFDERLRGEPALESLALLERIVRGQTVVDKSTESHAQLKLSGIVKANSKSELVIRNRMYARLFDREWLRSLAPKKQLLWLRRTAAVAVSLLAIVAIAVYAYLRFFLPHNIAESYLNKLQDSRTSLHDAKEYRAILTGERADPATQITIRGYVDEANKAYGQKRREWIRDRIKLANESIDNGQIENGLMRAAFVADESGEPLDPHFENVYAARGYDHLVVTLHSSSVFWPGLAVSADGHNVAIGNVWWVERGGQWHEVAIDNTASVNTVAFGPAGELYTGDDDGAITKWQFDADGKLTRKTVTVVEGGTRVLDLAIEGDGRPAIIAEGDNGGGLKISEQSVVLKISKPPAAIAVEEDGKSIVTVAGDALSVWKLSGGLLNYRRKTVFRDVAIGADGLIAVADPRSVALLKGKSSLEQIASIAHAPPVRSVALSGSLLATASDEGARVFDLKSLRDLGLPLGEGKERRDSNVQAVAFDAARNRLIVRRRDLVQIWSLGGKSESRGTRLQQWERKFGLEIPANSVFR